MILVLKLNICGLVKMFKIAFSYNSNMIHLHSTHECIKRNVITLFNYQSFHESRICVFLRILKDPWSGLDSRTSMGPVGLICNDLSPQQEVRTLQPSKHRRGKRLICRCTLAASTCRIKRWTYGESMGISPTPTNMCSLTEAGWRTLSLSLSRTRTEFLWTKPVWSQESWSWRSLQWTGQTAAFTS